MDGCPEDSKALSGGRYDIGSIAMAEQNIKFNRPVLYQVALQKRCYPQYSKLELAHMKKATGSPQNRTQIKNRTVQKNENSKESLLEARLNETTYCF